MQVSQSLPRTTVPHKWSHSINAIAIMCREKEVVSKLQRETDDIKNVLLMTVDKGKKFNIIFKKEC